MGKGKRLAETGKGFSGSALKWIALALMVLDHIHYIFGYTGRVPEWFSMAGRLSAPLFLFCLAEGFAHTHNRRRYFLKVWGLSILMNGLLFLALCGLVPARPDGFYPMNGMMTTFAVLMPVFQGMDWLAERKWRGLLLIGFPLAWPVLAGVLMGMVPGLQFPLTALGYTLLPMWNSNADASLPVIFTGILLYLFRKRQKTQAAVFVGFTMAYFFCFVGLAASQQPGFHWAQMFTDYYEWYGAFAALLMLRYNGQKGGGPRAFFYGFYPAHVYLLYAASCLLYPA